MFATTSCTLGSVLVVVRFSCHATLTLSARPTMIISPLLVDLKGFCRVLLLSRAGSGGLALCGGIFTSRGRLEVAVEGIVSRIWRSDWLIDKFLLPPFVPLTSSL